MSVISDSDFDFYKEYLLNTSGLAITSEKAYLLTTRLTPVAKSLGFADLHSFTTELRTKMDAGMLAAVVEAMTTNETSFFRDIKPFNTLKEMLPELMERRKDTKKIRIWSAACSSGQEAYSIAIVLDEFFKDKPGWTYEIVGTDISDDIVKKAQKGEYSQFEIQRGLTIQMMMKHFKQENGNWYINEDMRSKAHFRNLNLLEDYGSLGVFDIIFCRNVLIYFNAETKANVLSKMTDILAEDGHIFLGACETIMNLDVPLANSNIAQTGIYCRPDPLDAIATL